VSVVKVPSLRRTGQTSARRGGGVLADIRRHWADYLYILPALLVLIVVIAYPFTYTIYLSFFETPASSPNWYYVGVDNYVEVLTSPSFWSVTLNTLYWTIGSTVLAVIIGFGAALVVNRDFPGRGLVRGLLLIPWVISAVPAAYVWRWLYHSDYGLISGVLMQLGLITSPIIFLDSLTLVMPSVIVPNVWKEFPFAMVMFLAGLQTVPEPLVRAARVDGANAWQRFWHVTIPHLRGVVLITTILLFVTNMNSFTLIWIMTGGGPANASQIWITQVYTLAFQSLQYGLASAFAVILFVVMLAMGYFYVRALTGGQERRAE
jgi:multiple sugar transport system permease protein